MASNQAAWLDGAKKQLRVAEAPMPKADADRVIIRNKAVAVNPVDWKVQDYGLFFKSWPAIVGCDVAGDIEEVGANVKHLKKGDRVAAHTISLLTQQAADGGFALYSSAQAATTAVLPSNVSYNEGSVVPLAFDTAATGLYSPASDGYLGLSLPSLSPSSSGKTIVVYGGSSSVGALAIQLGVQSGAKVVAVASERNHEFCKKLGASEVFDYKNSSVADDVVKAVKSIGGDFVGVYDAISLPDSFAISLPILEKLGGGQLATVLPPPEKRPSNVKAGHVFGISKVTHPLWENYVTKALESGQLKAVPEPLVVGKGLESVQKGLDENKKGVSAKKVVIEL